jgi:hypothetical protein
MADDEVERVVVVRDALGVGDAAVDVQTEPLTVAGGDLDHAWRQVGYRATASHARLDQVQ